MLNLKHQVPVKPSGLPSDIIFIPFHVPSSKNSRVRTKTGLFIASKSVNQYRKFSGIFWKIERSKFLKLIIGVEPPYLVGFHFIRKTSHKYDWVNPLQTVQDEMVKYRWIDDDNIDFIMPVPFRINDKYSSKNVDSAGVLIKLMKTWNTYSI